MSATPLHSRGPSPRRRAARTLATLTVAGVLAALAVTPTPAYAVNLPWEPDASSRAFNSLTSVSNPDWMAQLPDSTRLGDMSIPGTHDTLAIHGGLAPMFYETQENHGDNAETLLYQLDAGIRSIDIRVRVVGDSAFVVHHTDVYQNASFDDVLTKARAFLAAHPGETILMKLHGECEGDSTESGTGGVGHCTDDPSNITQADRLRILKNYLNAYPGLFYAPSVSGTTAAATPTLGQARGHIVLEAFTGPLGEPSPGYGLANMVATPPISWAECNLDTRWSELQRNLQLVAADTSGDIADTGLSASCPPTSLSNLFSAVSYVDVANGYGGGEGENPRLLDYLNATPGHTGVIEMDWPGGPLIGDIIAHNTLDARSHGLWSTTRLANGSWGSWSDVPLAGLPGGNPPTQMAAAGIAFGYGGENGYSPVLAQGSDGNFYFNVHHSDGTWDTNWSPLPGVGSAPNFGGPSASIASVGHNRQIVAAVGLDGNVWYNLRVGSSYSDVPNDTGARWIGWTQISGSFHATKVSITKDRGGDDFIMASGTVTAGGVTSTNTYVTRDTIESGTWSNWQQLAGLPTNALTGDIAIAGLGNGNGAQLVGIDSTNEVWHQVLTVQSNGTLSFAGWARPGGVGGNGYMYASHIAAVGMDNGDAQFAAIGTDNKLYHNIRYSAGNWQGFATPAGISGAPYFTANEIAIADLGNSQTATLANAH